MVKASFQMGRFSIWYLGNYDVKPVHFAHVPNSKFFYGMSETCTISIIRSYVYVSSHSLEKKACSIMPSQWQSAVLHHLPVKCVSAFVIYDSYPMYFIFYYPIYNWWKKKRKKINRNLPMRQRVLAHSQTQVHTQVE